MNPTIDPTIIAAIAGAAGGAAGILIEKAWASGEKWLATYFQDYQPKAIEQANNNALDFLTELANRVRDLEEKVKDAPDSKKQIKDALSDPDFSALLHDAMIYSARTNSDEKHKLLSLIVSERLLAKGDSLVALAGNLACDAIPHLSPKHLRCLAIMTTVYVIRPIKLDMNLPDERLSNIWNNWFIEKFSKIMPVGEMSFMDFSHLVSVSCITYEPHFVRDLKSSLSPQDDFKFKYKWNSDSLLKDNAIGKELSQLWEQGMRHSLPLPVGQLIGAYVSDLLVGEKTAIDWK